MVFAYSDHPQIAILDRPVRTDCVHGDNAKHYISRLGAGTGRVSYRVVQEFANVARTKACTADDHRWPRLEKHSVFWRLGHAAHRIKLGVGLHAAEAGHAVAQAKKRGDGGDVPGVFVVKAVGFQGVKVGVFQRVGS